MLELVWSTLQLVTFSATVDKRQLEALQPLLDVQLVSWPKTVQVLSSQPDKVEYLIVQ